MLVYMPLLWLALVGIFIYLPCGKDSSPLTFHHNLPVQLLVVLGGNSTLAD